eukprot:TRINITY_DN14680_c1_g1_i1.p1 TRINITY_DN14680_c1_g1~~TRINITY_DN14680_c1_g1_i1.p1  ORF type:complete len:889 (+),score=257.32 TRINITY_DN14680_c1_g1_i1:148-2814(+)
MIASDFAEWLSSEEERLRGVLSRGGSFSRGASATGTDPSYSTIAGPSAMTKQRSRGDSMSSGRLIGRRRSSTQVIRPSSSSLKSSSTSSSSTAAAVPRVSSITPSLPPLLLPRGRDRRDSVLRMDVPIRPELKTRILSGAALVPILRDVLDRRGLFKPEDKAQESWNPLEMDVVAARVYNWNLIIEGLRRLNCPVFEEDKNRIIEGNLETALRVARMIQQASMTSSSSSSSSSCVPSGLGDQVVVPKLPLHLVPMDWRTTPGKGLSERSNLWKRKALMSFREESTPLQRRTSRPIDLHIPFSPKKIEDERKIATERTMKPKMTPRVFAMSPFTEFENIRRKMTDDVLTEIFITQERDIESLADAEKKGGAATPRARIPKKPSPEKIYKSNVHEIAKLSLSLDEHRQWLHRQLEGTSADEVSPTDAGTAPMHDGSDGASGAAKTPRPPKTPRRLGELHTSRKRDLHAQVLDRLDRLRYDVSLQRELMERCREYRRKDLIERKETEESKWKLVKENMITAKSFSRRKKIERIRECAIKLQEKHKNALKRHEILEKEKEEDKRRQLERTETRLKKIEGMTRLDFLRQRKAKKQWVAIIAVASRISKMIEMLRMGRMARLVFRVERRAANRIQESWRSLQRSRKNKKFFRAWFIQCLVYMFALRVSRRRRGVALVTRFLSDIFNAKGFARVVKRFLKSTVLVQRAWKGYKAMTASRVFLYYSQIQRYEEIVFDSTIAGQRARQKSPMPPSSSRKQGALLERRPTVAEKIRIKDYDPILPRMEKTNIYKILEEYHRDQHLDLIRRQEDWRNGLEKFKKHALTEVTRIVLQTRRKQDEVMNEIVDRDYPRMPHFSFKLSHDQIRHLLKRMKDTLPSEDDIAPHTRMLQSMGIHR